MADRPPEPTGEGFVSGRRCRLACGVAAWLPVSVALLVGGCVSTGRSSSIGPEPAAGIDDEFVAIGDGDSEAHGGADGVRPPARAVQGGEASDVDLVPDRSPLDAARRKIVDDLADALAEAMDPRTTTLQVNRDARAPMTLAYAEALSARGFGIQRVSADQGAWLLGQGRADLGAGDAATYLLRAGPIELARDYDVRGDGTVVAISALRVAGTRAAIAPVRGIERGAIPSAAFADRIEYVGPRALPTPPPLLALVTAEVVEAAAVDIVGMPARTGVNADRVEVPNLYFDGALFENIADTHRRVQRRVVVFGDDSMVLGEDNRALLGEFVRNDVRESDLVGLVGCSNGPTTLDIGNEGLALGRAARVADELVARGVPREQVRDEGCWGPSSVSDRFPGRGVVIELWRRAG